MNIRVTLTSSLLSGIIGVVISTIYHRRYESRKMKLDLIRRLAGEKVPEPQSQASYCEAAA